MIYGGFHGVMRLRVPAAYGSRPSHKVMWLATCAWLCYQDDLLGSGQSLNQKCERYVAENDSAVYRPAVEWLVPKLPLPHEKPGARRKDKRRVS